MVSPTSSMKLSCPVVTNLSTTSLRVIGHSVPAWDYEENLALSEAGTFALATL